MSTISDIDDFTNERLQMPSDVYSDYPSTFKSVAH